MTAPWAWQEAQTEITARTCAWCAATFQPRTPGSRQEYCCNHCVHRAHNLRVGRRRSGPEGDNMTGAELLRIALNQNYRNVPWGDDRPCNGLDADLFFPVPERGAVAKDEYRRQVARAKTVCSGCPYRAACADYAVEHRINFGIWGGLTEEERRQLRPNRQETA